MEYIDIGHDHRISYICFSPDRELNPQYKDIPDIEPLGIIIEHKTKSGEDCSSGVYFDLPNVRKVLNYNQHLWHVQSLEPLTISPSVLCMRCCDHGFIREGKWVPA